MALLDCTVELEDKYAPISQREAYKKPVMQPSGYENNFI
jgi:hypothetical protein